MLIRVCCSFKNSQKKLFKLQKIIYFKKLFNYKKLLKINRLRVFVFDRLSSEETSLYKSTTRPLEKC